MTAKKQLRERFSRDPYKYYHVKLFDELGFVRKKCSCGKFFWTLDEKQDKCPDPPCTNYGFIGDSPSKTKLDYIDAWKATEKFFVKNKHTSIKSYPTVCRWFPGLYFNIASITSFQRSIAGKTVFEFPANPLIIPQVCLRFNDIPNVGVSGRHHTSFIMVGQHSMYNPIQSQTDAKETDAEGVKRIASIGRGYWKDRCIELDWNLLTKVFKIPENEISFVENVWVGPSAFGYSLEYFVRGLELGNAVFTEFLGTPNNFTTMENKIIDMGAGHERFVWLINGTPTSYDSAFGPVIEKLKKTIDYDHDLFLRYAKISGGLNLDEISNMDAAKNEVAKKLGIDYEKLKKNTERIEAVYAIADHAKTLLYAITDGQLPSNVGGGYNLRVILRRALGFIDEFKLDIDLFEVCKMHAQYLKQLDKRLVLGLDELKEIIGIEEKRFSETRGRAIKLIENAIDKKLALDKKKLIELYESHGVTPEIVNAVVKQKKVGILIPPDLYTTISEKHMGEKNAEEKVMSVSGLPDTQLLFYENQKQNEFTARVLKITENKAVILDKTYFYGRSGGQEPDSGTINGCRVYDVEKIGNIIIHFIENPNFKEGDVVDGKIDTKRRSQLTQHHSATHIINASAVKILGAHVWQHSAFKDVDKSKLDITHYELLNEKQFEKIERLANQIVEKAIPIKKHVLPRTEAERKYGFRIYQGGAVPEKDLRIIDITNVNVQSCAGLHCDNTKEVGEIILLKQERVQDGVIRLFFVAGGSAEREKEKQKKIVDDCVKILNVAKEKIIPETRSIIEMWKLLRKAVEKKVEHQARDVVQELDKKFYNNVLVETVDGDMRIIQALSKELSNANRVMLLFGKTQEKIFVFGAAGESAIEKNINIGEIVRNVCAELGGKGGGLAGLGQGIGNDFEKLDEVIIKIRTYLQAML